MPTKFFLFFSVIFFSFFSLAAEIYTVKSVKISATNKSASIARNIAIENGQIKAFQILVKQHFPDAASKTANISKDSILNTVAGFELSNEKRSITNYFATLNVKFSKNHLDKLMKSLGAEANHLEKEVKLQSKPVESQLPYSVTAPTITTLLIPVYEYKGKLKWIEEDNSPWYDYLNSQIIGISSKNAKFTLPIGDIEDLNILNKHILSKNIIDLNSLMERYNVNNIALVKLVNVEEEAGTHYELQLNYINKFTPKWQQHNIDNLSGEKQVDIFKTAYELIDKYNFSNHQLKKNFNLTSHNKIIINFNIDIISDWIHLEGLLKDAEYIKNIKLINMNIKNYIFSFDYQISYLDLVEFFRSQNYELTEEADGIYKLVKANLNAEY